MSGGLRAAGSARVGNASFVIRRLATRVCRILGLVGLATLVFGSLLLVATRAYASASPLAYVANGGSNTVSVINTSTNKVVNTVTVGSRPFGVAITANGSFAYVVNDSSNSVSVIKTATNKVVKTVTVGSGPVGVAIT